MDGKDKATLWQFFGNCFLVSTIDGTLILKPLDLQTKLRNRSKGGPS